MKTFIFPLILAALLLTNTSCQKAKEEYVRIPEHDIWNQDSFPEMYENGQVVPARDIFNCRRDLSSNEQRYMRLKINENRIEANGTTTIYRFAQVKHLIKTVVDERHVTFGEHVTAYVDVTVENLSSNTKRITLVYNPPGASETPLFAPVGSDIESIVAGDEVAEVSVSNTTTKQISLYTHYHSLGAGENESMDCEFIDL